LRFFNFDVYLYAFLNSRRSEMNVVKALGLEDNGVSVTLLFVIAICSCLAMRYRAIFAFCLFHPYSIVRNKESHRVITSCFVHVNWPHLGINLFMLYAVGVNLEKYLVKATSCGHMIFAAIIALTHISGTLLVTFIHYKDFEFSSVGASGSILGSQFCYMVLQPHVVAFYLPLIGPVSNIFAGLLIIVLLLRQRYKSKQLFNHELHFYASVSGALIGIALKEIVLLT